MGTKIEMVNDTDNGEVTLDAVYKEDDQKPSYIMIEDYRGSSSPVKMRLEYDSHADELGLTHINGNSEDDESIEDLVDEEILVLIEELYSESVKLEKWRSIDQVVRYTRNGIGKVTGSIGSIIRNKSEDLF